MKQWWRIRVYYNGQALSTNSVTITGDFEGYNPKNKDLYVDTEYETEYDILCDYASEGVPYEITYNPETNTLDIQDDEPEQEVVIPTEGLYYEHTAPDTTLMAPEKVEISEDGTYKIVLDLAAWRYVVIYYNGVVVDSADANLTSSLSGGVYIDDTGAPSSRFYVNAVGKYQFVYTPAADGANASLVAGKYVEPQDPDGKDDFVFTVANDEYAKVYSEGVVDTISLWRLFIIVDAEGKVAYMCEMPRNGYGGIESNTYVRHSSYADHNNNPAFSNGSVVVPANGFALELYSGNADVQALMTAITGVAYAEHVMNTNTLDVDNVRLALADGKVTVSYVEETPEENEDFKFTVSSDQYGVIFTEGSVDTKSKWRFYIIVTAEGKIAYMCDMPINGYGGIGSDSFARHSSFADHNNNPVFSGDAIVVPAGGFALELYSGADGAASVKDLIQAITGAAYEQHGVNTNALDVDKVRLALADGVVTVTYVEEETPVEPEDFTFAVSSDEYAVVFTEGSVDTLSKWRLYIVVDGEGKIAYMCEMPINGYGGMASDTYIRHSSYAVPANNPAFSDGAVVVPQGGYVLELFQGNANVQALMTAITGLAYAEHAINTNTINVDAIRLTLVDGVVTVSTVEEPVTPPAEKVEVTFGGTLSGNAVYDEATGNYEMVADLKTWNNIILYVNGAAVSVKDLTVSGLFNPNAGADWTENLYYEGEDTTKLFTCTGGKYVLVYNHSAATLNISLYSVTYGGTLSGNVNYNAALGAYEAVVELATWNHIILYVNGKAVSVKDLTVTGLLNPNQGADWTENLYCEGDDFTKLYTCTGGKYVLALNPDAKTLNISLYVEPEAFTFAVSSDEYAAVFTEGTVDTVSKWRLYIIVDGEGKIAYMCEMPRNGYGGMASDTYIRHSSYADAANNPAFSDGAVVVPAGGFALELYSGDTDVQALMTAITGIAYAEHAINTNSINVDAIRLTLVEGVVTVSK